MLYERVAETFGNEAKVFLHTGKMYIEIDIRRQVAPVDQFVCGGSRFFIRLDDRGSASSEKNAVL